MGLRCLGSCLGSTPSGSKFGQIKRYDLSSLSYEVIVVPVAHVVLVWFGVWVFGFWGFGGFFSIKENDTHEIPGTMPGLL